MEHEILSLGASRPTRVVGLFHGLGGSRVSLEPLALQWAEALPRTAFLLFDAGDGDWFPYPKKRAEVHTEEAWVEMVLEAVRGAIGRADALLDERLGALGLTNDALVLGGFSQGAAMSAYTGLRRGCLGVLPMGGPCPPRPQLLPDTRQTRVCVITGDADPYAPHELISSCFAKYHQQQQQQQQQQPDGVHIIPGLAHSITEDHARLGLDFLRSCGCA